MTDGRAETGKRGEDEACRYLKEHGHDIVARNWRSSHLELDVVSLKGNGLHIVEVKSRTAPVMADPELNVTWKKQKRLVSAAKAFMASEERRALPLDLEVFFDVVTVVFDGTDFEVEYYPQAFIPIYA